MDRAKRICTRRKGYLNQCDKVFVAVINRVDAGETISDVELEHIISDFEKRLGEFEECQEQLEELIEDDTVLKTEVRETCDYKEDKIRNYLKVKNFLRLKKDKVAKVEQIDNCSSTAHVKKNVEAKLPKLELPKFGGDVTQWQSFYDRFKAIIDSRSDIDDVNKFSYLQSLLRDEAKACVQGLSLTADNYAIAKNLLEKRLGIKRG